MDYTFNNEGNIHTKVLEGANDTKTYVYEYDTKHNPFLTVFENQEIRKLSEHNPNNILQYTRTSDIGTVIYSYEYTYNELDYPITRSEFQNGTLVAETVYMYQQ